MVVACVCRAHIAKERAIAEDALVRGRGSVQRAVGVEEAKVAPAKGFNRTEDRDDKVFLRRIFSKVERHLWEIYGDEEGAGGRVRVGDCEKECSTSGSAETTLRRSNTQPLLPSV